ncbi:hypothetical protein [Duganella callida]|uniref:Uncharacterized protein n=1 Tax=Duganella callida TaxID=2561932 RepID=A0A4Y9SD16_9BURK|nr:hypothetical protein [Duganella callida]TFW17695.1 hypothetical protein E4L98_19965 [Duganella callida]
MLDTFINDPDRIEQAAQLLNVSTAYLLRQLDAGRISLDKLEAYKEEQRKVSEQALQELADQAQELDMGY